MKPPPFTGGAAVTLRARQVFPVRRPPLEDGAVRVAGGRIEAVGPWVELRREAGATRDLGEVALFPGLVNAHCHLDYTDLAGEIPPRRGFTDWIMGMKAAKDARTLAEIRAAWRAGAEQLSRRGVTTVADAEAFPELLPDLWAETPLRVRSFLELIRIRADLDAEEPARRAVDRIRAWPEGRRRAGLSPHAPYSTTPALLSCCARLAEERELPLMIHAAESREEFEMFTAARGPLFEWLRANGRDMSDCDGRSPVAHLARTGVLGPRTLVVHANYLAPGDAEQLARSGATVVHCPRSHAYFGHAPFPLAELRRTGTPVCLGTDSLATVEARRGVRPELDLRAEMAEFARRFPDVPPAEILRMATLNGARALGRAGRAGELTAGAEADLVLVPSSGGPDAVRERWVRGALEVGAVLLGGRWVGDREPGP